LSDDGLFFVADTFEPSPRPPRRGWDDDDDVDLEASSYLFADHGPEPVPEWLITEDAARQHEDGLLKTGKEADVFLIERTLGGRSNLLAAKRYRDFEDRLFRNDVRYRQSRRTGDVRADRAMAKATRTGMAFRAGQWVETEFETMCRLWRLGVPVPYPVQMLGHEIMLEYLGDEERAAPRLVDFRADAEQLGDLYRQLVAALTVAVRHGVVHGDLSPYNLLVWHDRLYLIDFPQAVDPVLNPDGLNLLSRDVINTCAWFAKRGVAADASELLADPTTEVFSR
jgi:RIO kinase 1